MPEDGNTFELGLNWNDIKRVLWTFVMGLIPVAVAIATGALEGNDAWWVPLAMAALSAIKNGVLSDESALK